MLNDESYIINQKSSERIDTISMQLLIGAPPFPHVLFVAEVQFLIAVLQPTRRGWVVVRVLEVLIED